MGLNQGMPAARREQKIACQQVLLDDASVFSIQRSVFPASLAASITPELLLNRYLSYIRRCTATIIRPHCMPDGIEFRLLGSSLSLLSFLLPITEGNSLMLRIRGGLLVQVRQCDRGEFRFEVEESAEGIRVTVQLSDYCPLILGGPSPPVVRRWLYRLTQAAIHRLVTVRFLASLYRELAGSYAPVRVVGVKVREGRPV